MTQISGTIRLVELLRALARRRRAAKGSVRFSISRDVRVSIHDSGIAILCLRSGRLFTANNIVARSIWRGIAAGENTDSVCREISSKYAVPLERVHEDATEFLAKLESQGLIRREAPRAPSPVSMWEALWELLRYDLVMAIFGFRRIHAQLERTHIEHNPLTPGLEAQLSIALSLAISFYWKPVRCLQRSVTIARLLRNRGVAADLVIGYRAVPFFSHSWVEVKGQVINESHGYSRRLCVLDRVRCGGGPGLSSPYSAD